MATRQPFLRQTPPPPIYSHVKFSPHGIEIGSGKTSTHAVAAMMWSDDCDPQNSKKNRKALWCLTITFVQDTDVTIDTPIPTYPIAVGPKGSDHRKVLRRILADLTTLRSEISPLRSYVGVGLPPIPVSLEVFAYLGDQPERRGLNFLMLGGSTHHARWRYSCNTEKLSDVLRACSYCENMSLQMATSGIMNPDQLLFVCSKCTNWWMHEDHPLLIYEAPAKFPPTHLLGGIVRTPGDEIPPGMLRPLELTYPVLTTVCNMAHDMIVNCQWGSATAEVFLNTHCINGTLTDEIIEHADNCLQFELAMANSDDPATKNLFKEEKRKRPKAFSRALLPPFYNSSLSLNQFVDPPLHLIALGLVKTTFKVIDIWTTNRGRKTEFLRIVKPELMQIQNLDLDWCEVISKNYGGKYGGWISDNYMALARISPWLYLSILVLTEPEPYTEPTTPVDKWRVQDCRGYLKLRGIKVPKYLVDQKLAVWSDKNKTESERAPILDTPVCSPRQVFQLICRMYQLIAALFQDSINPVEYANLLEVRIRLFLSAFDRLDLATRTTRTASPRWITSYNFMCLLNIPGIVRKFGPYRNLYEGKYCGEAFNRVLKPMANRGSHRNRCYNLMRNLAKEKAMSAIQENFENHEAFNNHHPCNNPEMERSSIYRMAHRYKTKRKAVSHYHKNVPLSVLIYMEEGERRYGVSYIVDNQQYFSPIVRDGSTEMVICGVLVFWHWELAKAASNNRKIESVSPIDYGVLLPLTYDPEQPGWTPPSNYYTITSYVWNSEDSLVYV